MQLSVKAFSALQATQERKKKIAAKMVENHVNHDIKMSYDIIERVKEQVKVITQHFAYFKAKIVEFTTSI